MDFDLPTNALLFLKSLVNRDKPITEKDFSKSDLARVYKLANDEHSYRQTMFNRPPPPDAAIPISGYPTDQNGGLGGNALVRSFTDPSFRVGTMLGRFTATKQPDGGFKITDTYDWDAKDRPAQSGREWNTDLISLGDTLATLLADNKAPIKRPVNFTAYPPEAPPEPTGAISDVLRALKSFAK